MNLNNKEFFKLPKLIKNSDIYISKPFLIFEIYNIFRKDIYIKLQKQFPKESYFKNKFKIGNKLYLNNNEKNFHSFLEKNNIYSNLYNYLNSPKTFKKIYDLVKKDLRKINKRKNVNNYLLININNKYIIKLLKNLLGLFGIKIIKLGFEFSIIKKASYIPLHTDKPNKLISLMIYFPDPTKRKKQINWGTCFYKPKNSGKKIIQWDSSFMSDAESLLMMQSLKKFYQSKFTVNKLVGFLKSDCSFHNVQVNEKNVLRKSININYYIQ